MNGVRQLQTVRLQAQALQFLLSQAGRLRHGMPPAKLGAQPRTALPLLSVVHATERAGKMSPIPVVPTEVPQACGGGTFFFGTTAGNLASTRHVGFLEADYPGLRRGVAAHFSFRRIR